MRFRRPEFQKLKSNTMADPAGNPSKKPLTYLPKERKQKPMKMKVGSAASKVRFVGWRFWSKNAKSWYQSLRSGHQSTWKNAGIYDAIMALEYPIKRHDELILELASRWCSETNTFIFPWGEATVTLEDVMVLGGFSISGVTKLSPPENDAVLLRIMNQLELARKEVQRGKSHKATHGGWVAKFMGNKSDVEHEAFIMLWLSRFVFPAGSSDIINRHIFHIAIQLSRGIKFALARPVLAMIYKDLTALNKRLVEMAFVSDTGNNDKNVQLDVFGAFHIVQIWAWERLPLLKPITKCLHLSEDVLPRAARWSEVTIMKDWDLMSSIDLGEESFIWCPYGELDKESFAECIKPGKLEGFDSCVEKYLPQRVAMQFALVQDIPTDHGDDLTSQTKLKDYKLFVKSRLAKPTTTAGYKQWWKQQRSSLKSSHVKVEKGIDIGPPPGFPPRIDFITISDSDSDFDSDDDFGDEGDALPTASTLAHVPISQIRLESSFSSSISDNVITEIDELSLKSSAEVVEKSEKTKDQLASSSKAAQIKEDYVEQVVTIDDSSEDEDDDPFVQHGNSMDTEMGKGLDSMNILKLDECKNYTCSNQGSGDDTKAVYETHGFDKIASTSRNNGPDTDFDAASFTDDRTPDSYLNLDARISKLEKLVFALNRLKDQ